MKNEKTFFRDLVNNSLINEWAENIDWLFRDDKFEKWGKSEKTRYSKMIKRYLANDNVIFERLLVKEFNEKMFEEKIREPSSLYVYINVCNSEGIDLLRHIRNGIAHSHCSIEKNKRGKLLLRITDYNKNKERTAEIKVPIDIITKLRNLYKNIPKMNKK